MNAQNALRGAAIFAFLAVALGAFGAHALKEKLIELDGLETWKTGVFYQMVHALAMVILALWANASTGEWRGWRLGWWFFAVGIVLFSGSLYGLALGGSSWLGPITPLGGICFLCGWMTLVFSRLRNK